MTTEQMNKYVAEKLGLCWHEPIFMRRDTGEIKHICTKCMDVVTFNCNPDFSQGSGIIRLLEEVMKHKTWTKFACEYFFNDCATGDVFIPIDYMIIPGKLLEAVVAWWEERKVRG